MKKETRLIVALAVLVIFAFIYRGLESGWFKSEPPPPPAIAVHASPVTVDAKVPTPGPIPENPLQTPAPVPSALPTAQVPTSAKALTDFIVANQGRCVGGHTPSCNVLAESLLAVQGVVERLCVNSPIGNQPCFYLGGLISEERFKTESEACEKGLFRSCWMVAGFYDARGKRAETLKTYRFICDREQISDPKRPSACEDMGADLTATEVAESVTKCEKKSAKDCIIVAGYYDDKDLAKSKKYYGEACAYGDQWACTQK